LHTNQKSINSHVYYFANTAVVAGRLAFVSQEITQCTRALHYVDIATTTTKAINQCRFRY